MVIAGLWQTCSPPMITMGDAKCKGKDTWVASRERSSHCAARFTVSPRVMFALPIRGSLHTVLHTVLRGRAPR
eukprot:4101665-Prymnesium_polylepis.1